MDKLLESVSLSLESQNWYSALFMSLSIPDICAALESGDGKSSREKYIKWFDANLASIYKKKIGCPKNEHVFLTGADMYAFRCSMLHQFSDDTKSQKKKDKIGKFRMTVNNGHLNYNCDVTAKEIAGGDVLHIDVPQFCMEVLKAAKKWKQDKASLLANKKTAYIIEF
ncbi:MAG: hypothetical protein WC454_09265, partial [Phycisphaerae bacterium]|jgi:hypothetical protein